MEAVFMPDTNCLAQRFRLSSSWTCGLLLGLTGAVFADHGAAHSRWDPDGLIKPRSERDDNKIGPCGAARTDNPVVLQSGATIEVQFESTIYHQGHFRIAFSEADDQGFDDQVLADEIPDYPNQRYRSHIITLPDIECSACTLQLIQTMPDRNPPSDYFSCADIQLTATGSPPGDASAAPDPVSGAAALPGDSSANLHWLNPTDDAFVGVLVLQASQEDIPAPDAGQEYQLGDTVNGGRVVYLGSDEFAQVDDLLPGQSYYFHLFSYSAALAYSEVVVTAVDIPETIDNIAPTVTLMAEQSQRTGPVIHPNDGPVTVQALVTDMNPNDQHSYDWSATDSRLINSSQNPQDFIFDSTALPIGSYQITVTVTDDGSPPLSDTATLDIRVEQPNQRAGALHLWWLAGLLLIARARRRGV